MKRTIGFIISALKLFRFIFFVNPTYYISGFFKRNPNIWIIGSKNNFSDNSKYFYIFYTAYLKNNHKIDLIWISRSRKTVQYICSLNIGKCYYAYSFKGIAALILARVYIYSYGYSIDLPYFFSKNSIAIYLWHGVGIKNMNYTDNNPKRKRMLKSKVLQYLYPILFEKPDITLATSEYTAKYLSVCFNTRTEDCIISLYPRCNIFSYERNKILKFIEKYESSDINRIALDMGRYEKKYIYMPTWRDENPDFLINLEFIWEELDELLVKKNRLLIIKAHPRTKPLKLRNITNIIELNRDIDIYPILPLTDVLITDYSSIYFDYLFFIKRDIVLFPVDQDHFFEKRGVSSDYETHMPGTRIHNFIDFMRILDVESIMSKEDFEERERVYKLYWGSPKYLNHIIHEIFKKIDVN